MRVFVDTNLWIYRFDHREPEKQAFVRAWLRRVAAEHEIILSTQVLIEFRSAATRKLKPPLSAEELAASLAALAQFEVFPADANLVLDAHELAAVRRLSWFDALIVAAALKAGCSKLYSEDLQDGAQFGPLRIENPLP